MPERRERLPEQTPIARQHRSLSRSSSKTVFSFAPPAAGAGGAENPGHSGPRQPQDRARCCSPRRSGAAPGTASPHARRQEQVSRVPQPSPHRRGTAVRPRRSGGAVGRAAALRRAQGSALGAGPAAAGAAALRSPPGAPLPGNTRRLQGRRR
ncbi:unnamed protein product [Coccothraustes coccothraustes]